VSASRAVDRAEPAGALNAASLRDRPWPLGRFGATERDGLEVRAGIEPASADLQSDASPLCHRTPEARLGAKNRRNLRVTAPSGVRISEFPELS
jgi:hypothetical protein